MRYHSPFETAAASTESIKLIVKRCQLAVAAECVTRACLSTAAASSDSERETQAGGAAAETHSADWWATSVRATKGQAR